MDKTYRTMKKILLITAAIFLFTSCEKEDKKTPSGGNVQPEQTTYEFGVHGVPQSTMLKTWINDFETGNVVERGYTTGFKTFWGDPEARGWWKIKQSTEETETFIDFSAAVIFDRPEDSMIVTLWKDGKVLMSLRAGSRDTATIRGYY